MSLKFRYSEKGTIFLKNLEIVLTLHTYLLSKFKKYFRGLLRISELYRRFYAPFLLSSSSENKMVSDCFPGMD